MTDFKQCDRVTATGADVEAVPEELRQVVEELADEIALAVYSTPTIGKSRSVAERIAANYLPRIAAAKGGAPEAADGYVLERPDGSFLVGRSQEGEQDAIAGAEATVRVEGHEIRVYALRRVAVARPVTTVEVERLGGAK